MIAIEHIDLTISWMKHMANRYKKFPTDPQKATRTCPRCQEPVEPKGYEVEGVNYYQEQKCQCEIAAEEEEQKRREHRQTVKFLYHSTYEWLGERWSDLPLKKKTFATFDATKQSQGYEITKMYAANPNGTLVLYGSFGTGKTHLLAALCNEGIEQHERKSLFTTAPTLFSAIQQCISNHEDYNKHIEKAIKTPLLVIDDIDKAKWTEFREEIYFAIIDGRVKRELPTAISTNRLDALASFVGGAVCSRFKVGQIAVEMIGEDQREDQ